MNLRAIALALSLGAAAVAYADVTTVTGGVTLEERTALMQRYGDYNLHLAFAEPDGQYLAGVAVTARDASGNVVFTSVSDGPFVFASVPPGTYRVLAEYNGEAKSRSIQVGSGVSPLHYFRWEDASSDPR
jgi:hypothetical protein